MTTQNSSTTKATAALGAAPLLTKARYIYIRKNDGVRSPLALAEVQVLDVKGVNLAAGARVLSSQALDNNLHKAANAVDGKTGGDYQRDGLFRSESLEGGWLQIDLGSEREIAKVNVFGRSDNAAAENGNYTVYVGSESMGGFTHERALSTAGVKRYEQIGNGPTEVRIDASVYGYNHIRNGSFEQGSTGTTGLVQGWTKTGGAAAAGGAYAGAANRRTEGNNGYSLGGWSNQKGGAIEQTVNGLEAGQSYALSFDAGTLFNQNNASQGVQLKAWVYEVNAVGGIQSTLQEQTFTFFGAEGMSQRELIFTAKGANVQVKFEIPASQAASADFDVDLDKVQLRLDSQAKQYIYIRKNAGVSDHLSIAEIVLYNNQGQRIDILSHKSSKAYDELKHASNNAVDGKTGGNTAEDGIFASQTTDQGWIEVAIDASVKLEGIRIFGRSDGWSGQNGNYTVYVGSGPMGGLSHEDALKQQGVKRYEQIGNGPTEVRIDASVYGYNHIRNGSFEQASTGTTGLVQGWAKTGVAAGGAYAGSANRRTEGNNGYALGGWSNQKGGAIEQTVNGLEAGQSYALSFDAGTLFNQNNASQGVQLKAWVYEVNAVGGIQSTLQEQTFTFFGAEGMSQRELIFTAKGANVRVKFEIPASQAASADFDVDLDKVQLRLVNPEQPVVMTKARYIYIRKNEGANSPLALAEVQVLDVNGVNLAAGARVLSSQALDNNLHKASNAVDGITGGDWQRDGLFRSESLEGGWLQIDLGSEREIARVNVFGRTDAHQAENGKYTVALSSSSMAELDTGSIRVGDQNSTTPWTGKTIDQIKLQTGVSYYVQTGTGSTQLQLSRLTKLRKGWSGVVMTNARYIYIRKNDGVGDHLSLAEVQVLDVNGVNLAKDATVLSSQAFDNNLTKASNVVDGKTGGDWQRDGIFASASLGGGWLQIDLGSEREIAKVNVFGRTDGYQGQNGNYTVALSSTTMVQGTGPNTTGKTIEQIKAQTGASYFEQKGVNTTAPVSLNAWNVMTVHPIWQGDASANTHQASQVKGSVIDGKAGNDTVKYVGNYADYEVGYSAGLWTVGRKNKDNKPIGQVDFLFNIEQVQFDDVTVVPPSSSLLQSAGSGAGGRLLGNPAVVVVTVEQVILAVAALAFSQFASQAAKENAEAQALMKRREGIQREFLYHVQYDSLGGPTFTREDYQFIGAEQMQALMDYHRSWSWQPSAHDTLRRFPYADWFSREALYALSADFARDLRIAGQLNNWSHPAARDVVLRLNAQAFSAFNADDLSLFTPQLFGDLTGDQISHIRPEALARLSAQQLGAIQPAAFAQLTNEHISSMPASAFASLSAQQLAATPPTLLQYFSPEQTREIQPQSLAALTGIQVSALTDMQIDGLTAAQLGYTNSHTGSTIVTIPLISRLTRQQLAQLPPTTLGALTWRDHLSQASIGSNATTTVFSNLDYSSYRHLDPSVMANVGLDTLRRIQGTTFDAYNWPNYFTSQQIASLSPDVTLQLDWFELLTTTSDVKKVHTLLKENQIGPNARRLIDGDAWTRMVTGAQIASMSPAGAAQLREAELQAKTKEGTTTVGKSLTAAQVAAYLKAQVKNPANGSPNINPDVFAQFNTASLVNAILEIEAPGSSSVGFLRSLTPSQLTGLGRNTHVMAGVLNSGNGTVANILFKAGTTGALTLEKFKALMSGIQLDELENSPVDGKTDMVAKSKNAKSLVMALSTDALRSLTPQSIAQLTAIQLRELLADATLSKVIFNAGAKDANGQPDSNYWTTTQFQALTNAAVAGGGITAATMQQFPDWSLFSGEQVNAMLSNYRLHEYIVMGGEGSWTAEMVTAFNRMPGANRYLTLTGLAGGGLCDSKPKQPAEERKLDYSSLNKDMLASLLNLSVLHPKEKTISYQVIIPFCMGLRSRNVMQPWPVAALV